MVLPEIAAHARVEFWSCVIFHVLGELEEKQESGKVFTKLHLGEYTWQTYTDVATQAESLGKGLRELGMVPKDKVLPRWYMICLHHHLTLLWHRWFYMQTQELSG